MRGCHCWMLRSLLVVNTTSMGDGTSLKEIEVTGKHIRLLRAAKTTSFQKSINLVYGLTDKLFLGSLIFSAIIFTWTSSRRRRKSVFVWRLGDPNKTIVQMLCESRNG